MSSIKTEYDRLSADKVDLNCPQIIVGKVIAEDITDMNEIRNQYDSIQDYIYTTTTNEINLTLESLVKADCKIIDYSVNVIDGGLMYYIKYTE